MDFTKRYKDTSKHLLLTGSEASRYKNGFMSANIKKENQENPFIFFDQNFLQQKVNLRKFANSPKNGIFK